MQVPSFYTLQDISHTPGHSVEDKLELVVELARVLVDELAPVLVDEQFAEPAVILALLSPSAMSMELSMVLAPMEVVA